MEPSMAKMLITSVEYKCSAEMLTIVSMLSVPSVFYRPKERMEEADAAREKFSVNESDHLTLLNVFNQWKSHGSVNHHPGSAGFTDCWRFQTLRPLVYETLFASEAPEEGKRSPDATGRHHELPEDVYCVCRNRLRRSQVRIPRSLSSSSPYHHSLLNRKAICSGYFHQAARVKGIGEFVNIRTGLPTHLHPTSALYGLGCTCI